MPRRKSALSEAIDAARAGMLDSKSSAAVRLRYFDRYCVLNKLLTVDLEESDRSGQKPEDIKTPSQLEEINDILARYDATTKSKAESAPDAATPDAKLTEFDDELERMLLQPKVVSASEQGPIYKGYSDLDLMRNKHVTHPKSTDGDWN